MNFKDEFGKVLSELLSENFKKENIALMIEKPKFQYLGDLAFPCFELSKVFRKSPQAIAFELVDKVHHPLFEKVEAVNGYVNVFLKKETVVKAVIKQIISQKDHYGNLNIGNNGVMTIDYSSPNIAKPFSMGHLRSTVIGHSLALLAEKAGYQTVRINHLGDWGTQFGKLIVAYKMWGNEEKVSKQPIKELLKLYVKFHEEAEKDPSLEELARQWFKKLEDGEEEALKLWKWFREESLKEFSRIYELMGIYFDSNHGEAFYNDKMDQVVQQLQEKNLLETSDGAQVVQIKDFPPCLIKKSDGTSLYATRDLAAAIYRQETYKFVNSLYVVGNEQTLHFKQLFAVLKRMGYEWERGMTHVSFGMMLKDGKKMSTRKGKIVLLEEVLKEAVALALDDIKKKNANLKSKETVAQQVGVGAVIFHDLKNYRQNDIEFSLEDMLKFEGETGPYVQYTHARACSLLRKGGFSLNDYAELNYFDEDSWPIVTYLSSFPDIIKRAIETHDPSQVTKYIIELARSFNMYYSSVRILDNSELKQNRLQLIYAVTIVLKEGLRLLGISAPEEM